ncbi:MAG TPA: VOC family protein [Terracidiphilus sp.]|nr:VOC family protein [Terracidiphilus sp.]
MLSKLTAVVLFVSAGFAAAQSAQHHPKITGISHLSVYTTDTKATEHYYATVIGAAKLPDPENPKGVKYALSATQWVEVLPLPAGAGVNRLDHSAFNTDDVEGMRAYLAARGWKTPGHTMKGADGSRWFGVLDPEGNKIEFVQPAAGAKVDAPNAVGHHIIHIGFLVHSRAKEDAFYRDLLGFKPYWFGGMQDDKIDWVSQQVPDGHDWLEYMMTSGPSGSGIPAEMSQRQLGVLDHLSIGAVSVDTVYAGLKASGRMEGTRTDAHTQIGKDGKGQFNLYDPDGIRLELMTFHALEKPCCSPFTADDPAE